ncbi:MAG: toprim domain-containing protein, partial [Mycoplasmoidaceae bacterium]|nr:toprim domain-containing protein [Mycoplasmoidaceae bacterium]
IYKILTNNNNFLGSQRSSELTWNEKELLEAGIIYLNEEERPTDFLIDRITIPIYDNNNYIVGFSGRTTGNSSTKYLNTGSTKVFSKGNLLFNFNRVRELNDKRVIIVEGFMDAIALYNCGHKNVLATMGVALTDKHLNLLNSLELETVILCFDNDNAGQLATIENGKKLMANGFNTYVIGKYDKQDKDVDELMQHKGKSAVGQIVENRRDFISYLIDIKLSNQKSLDEIQSNINFVLKEMADYGDVLLKTKHFELIEKLTGIKVNDLQIKFNEFNKQPSIYNKQLRNYNSPKKNQNFNFEEQQKELIELDNSLEVNLQKSVNISLQMSGQLVLSRVLNATRSLIAFLINHNEFIEKAYSEDLSFGKYFINQPEIKIFNNLSYLLSKDGKVTINSLTEYFKNKQDLNITNELLSQIASDDEFNLSSKTDKKRLVNKYTALLKTIITAKANYIK